MSFIMFLNSFAFAQRNERGEPGKKLEALEKIKLLETLNMDEDTAIKFFARRNEHQEKMRQFIDELDGKREKIKNKISSLENDNDPELKKLLDNYFQTQQKIEGERKSFFYSLTDILTYKQLAELTLFERRFREEIRDVLFHHNKKRKRN